MTIQRRAAILNGVILLTLLIELRFYSAMTVGVSALVLFIVANATLLCRARRERRRGNG